MSGHSKWATTKHKKAVIDARRAKSFAKLIKNIEVAARVGGADINGNPTLALYRTCQRYILLRLSAQAVRLRNQNGQTLAERLDEDADGIIDRLRKIPQDLGSSRPVSVTSATVPTPH